MSERTVSVRFAAVGGDKVKAEMRGIGAVGQESLQSIDAGTEAAGSGFDEMAMATQRAREKLEQISQTTARAMQMTARSTSDIQRRINATTGVSGVGRQSSAEILAHGQALDQLRAKYNPMFAVIQRYRQEVSEIRAANMSQAISEDEKAAAISRARQAALTDIAVIKGRRTQLQGLSRDTRVSTFHAQNMMFQFQDIGMMMVSGQSPFILAAQQGTQVAGVMQQMRDQGQSAFRGLLGGITRMFSPMSFLTIATIGGAAALGQWAMRAFSAKEDADELKKSIDSLGQVTKDLRGSLEKFKSPFSDLREEFGRNAEQARELYRVLIQLQRLEALDQQAQTAEMLTEQFDGLIWRVNRINQMQRENATIVIARQVRKLADEYGVAEGEARQLVSAIDDINSASTAEERNAAMQRMLDVITAVKDESGQIPEALRPIALQLAQAVQKGLVLSNTFDQVDEATGDVDKGVRSITGELGLAVSRALELRDALASAASASMSRRDQIAVLRSEIAAAQRGDSTAAARASAETAISLGRGGASVDQIAAAASTAGQEAATLERLQERLSALTKSESGGGSEKDEVAELVTSLKDQLAVLRETDPIKRQMIEYSEKMAGATSAEKAQILDLVVALDQAKNGWEGVSLALSQYAEEAKRIGDDIGDALVGAFQSAENAIGEFVKTGKLSFSDLVTSLIADLAKLAARKFILGPLAAGLDAALGGIGGGGGFFANFAGGFNSADGGGYTGDRSRTGGLDGRGGFLMMMHPRERVYDEAKGQRALAERAGPTVININGVRDAESFRKSRAQIASDFQRGLAMGRRAT